MASLANLTAHKLILDLGSGIGNGSEGGEREREDAEEGGLTRNLFGVEIFLEHGMGALKVCVYGGGRTGRKLMAIE